MSQSLNIPLTLGRSKAGLTLYAQLIDDSGENVGSVITTGFSDQEEGLYLFHYASYPDGFTGGIKFFNDADDSVVALGAINAVDFGAGGEAGDPLENELGGYASGTAGGALQRIGSGRITIVNPIATNNLLTLIQGDSYYSADSRALDFSSANWPVLTGASIKFTAKNEGDELVVTGSVVTPTGTKVVRIELTSLQTDSLTVGNSAYKYDIQATLQNTHIVTLVRGEMTVLSQQST